MWVTFTLYGILVYSLAPDKATRNVPALGSAPTHFRKTFPPKQ